MISFMASTPPSAKYISSFVPVIISNCLSAYLGSSLKVILPVATNWSTASKFRLAAAFDLENLKSTLDPVLFPIENICLAFEN